MIQQNTGSGIATVTFIISRRDTTEPENSLSFRHRKRRHKDNGGVGIGYKASILTR